MEKLQSINNLYAEQSIVTDLIYELKMVTNEKLNLDRENVALKLENQDLRQKLEAAECNTKIRKNLFDFQGLDNEELRERKLSMLEISNLKLSYCKQRELFEQRQDVLLLQIKHLETKLNENNEVLNDLRVKSEKNYKKYVSYKNKIKQAVIVIKNLASGKAEKRSNKTCQTEHNM
ncbi:hypothetical protein PPYR_06164 [Photinus pyralis]|uniref:Uncharacterized protein n=1 Tax=Photinus pyralis TaxID=7054 RepID=A0A5N4ASV3_PHOPY|nr:hypothetical protein PPYR_06164 [Photinus pyralis]